MNSDIGFSSFKERLAQMIGDEEPFKWAKRIGIPPATFDRMWNGGAMPKVETLLRIASATGASLDWLVSGHEPQRVVPSPLKLDDELMGRVTDAVSRLYKDERVGLPAIDLGRIAARKYAEIVAATENAAERLAMIKLVTTQLRAEIRAAAAEPGAGKASA